jgi:hypothetical protein
MPRNSDIVPIVTTMDGSLPRATSAPLQAPQSAPTASPAHTSAAGGSPAREASPMPSEASAMIAATERSISRTRISSAIGSAMIACSEKSAVASERFSISRKCGEIAALTASTRARTSSSTLSHRSRRSAIRRGLRSATW